MKVYSKSTLEGYSNNLFLRKLKGYYELMKPRVMSLVIFTAFVGMFLAPGEIASINYVIVIIAIAIGAGSSAAINMWFDEDIDKTMERTKIRPIPLGIVSKNEALVLGIFTGIISLILMQWYSNPLSTSLLLFTILFYILAKKNHLSKYRYWRSSWSNTSNNWLDCCYSRNQFSTNKYVPNYILLDTTTFLGTIRI